MSQPILQGAPETTATNRTDNTQKQQTALKTKQKSAAPPCEMTAATAYLGDTINAPARQHKLHSYPATIIPKVVYHITSNSPSMWMHSSPAAKENRELNLKPYLFNLTTKRSCNCGPPNLILQLNSFWEPFGFKNWTSPHLLCPARERA